jgi:hypothetical protein
MQTVTKLPDGVATYRGSKDGYELWRVEIGSGVQAGYDSAFLEPNYRIKIANPKELIGSFFNDPINTLSPISSSSEPVNKKDSSVKYVTKKNVSSGNYRKKENKKMNEDYFDYKFLLVCFTIILIVIVKRT